MAKLANKAIWSCDINVLDPNTDAEVELSVYKDPATGGMFAVDFSFLDQVSGVIPSPFQAGEFLICDDDGNSSSECDEVAGQ